MTHNIHELPIYFAPSRKLGGGWIAYKDSPDPPPAPDYTSAANATAAGNLETAKYTTEANRADQITPWGTLKWEQGVGADGKPNNHWTQTQTLSDLSQQALDAQLAVENGRSQAASTLLNSVQDQISKPLDTSDLIAAPTSVPQYDQNRMDRYAKAAYDKNYSLLAPQYAQSEQKLRNDLALQGLSNTSEAYGADVGNFYAKKNDALNQLANTSLLTGDQLSNNDYASELNGFNTTQNARSTQLQQKLAEYNAPLNQLTALLSGQQVQSPQFSSYAQQQQTAGPDYLQAAISGYDSQMNGYNAAASSAASGNSAMGSTIGAIGSAAIMAF